MSYDASLFFDEDEASPAPSPAPAPSRSPVPTKGPASSKGGYDASLFYPDEPAPAPAPAKAPDDLDETPEKPKDEGGSWEITKGFRKGVGSTPEMLAAAERARKYIGGAGEEEAKGGLAGTLESFGKTVGGEEDVAVPSFTDIKDVNTAFQYVTQNIGQAVGSSLAPMLTGAAGAAVGGATGSVVPVIGTGIGATVGGIGGAALSGIPLGIGTMFKALEDDKEIQQLVKDGKTTWKDLAEMSVPYGTAIGMLDVSGEAMLARIAGLQNIGKDAAKKLVTEQVKEKARDGIIKRIAVGAAKGAASEGVTEGTQQAIQEVGVAAEGGQRDLKKSAISVLDNVFAGILGGGAMGGPAGAVHHEGKKPGGLNAEGSPDTSAQDQKPGQTGTGEAHAPDASATPGTSTPGGAAPGPAAQPAGAAPKQTETAPPAETPPSAEGEGKAAPPAQTPPAGGVADPSLHAAITGELEDESDLTPEQEAWAAQNAPQPVPDPDTALALQGVTGPAEQAPQAPAGPTPPPPAAEPPAAPTTMPPGGPPPEGVAPTPGPPPPEAVQPPPAPAVAATGVEAVPSPAAPVGPGPTAEAPAAPVETPAIPPGAAAPQTVPEAPATLEAQRQQLVSGERKAVMYPKGTKPGPKIEGMERITVPKVGVFDFNPAQVLKEEVRNAAREGRENEILGLGPFNKEEVAATGGPEHVIAERTPEGVEVRAAGATPATAPVQQAVMEAGKTPGNIVAPEPIDQTLAARAAQAPAPAPAAAPAPSFAEEPTHRLIRKEELRRPAVAPAPAPAAKPAPAPAPASGPANKPTVVTRRRAVTRTVAELKAAATAAPQPAAAPAPTPKEKMRADFQREITDAFAGEEDRGAVAAVSERVMREVDEIIAKHDEAPSAIRTLVRERIKPERLKTVRENVRAEVQEVKAAGERKTAEELIDTLRARREEDARKEAGGGTAQEKLRGLQAKPADIRTRTRHDFEQTAKREAAKEGAPSFMTDTAAAIEERKPFAQGRGENARKRAALNDRIERNQEEWAKWAEARDEAAPAKPIVTREQEIEEEVEKAGLTPEERDKRIQAAKIAADQEANASAKAAVDAVVTDAVLKSDDPKVWRGAVDTMLEAYEGTLPRNILASRAPWVNFLAYAKRKTRGEMTVSDMADMGLAHDWVSKGQAEEFYAYTRDETKFGEVALPEKYVPEDSPRMLASSDIEDALSATPAPERTGDVLTNQGTGFTYQLHEGSAVAAHDLLDQTLPRRTFGEFVHGLTGNLFKVIDASVSKELKRLVGDTPVYRVPREAVRGLVTTANAAGVQGFYAKPSPEAAARGERGVIIISEHLTGHDLREVLQHEMVHAAADYALATNYLNTGKVIKALFAHAKAELEAQGLGHLYGLTNEREFMAEAMSNPAFQKELARLPVPASLQVKVQALNQGRLTSMWKLFIAHVSRIIKAAGFGQHGMTYTDALLRTFNVATSSQTELQQWLSTFSDREFYRAPGSNLRVNGKEIGEKGAALMRKQTPDEMFSEIFDSPNIQQTLQDTFDGTVIRNAHDAVSVRLKHDYRTRARIFRDRFLSNTMDIRRRADTLLQGLADKGETFKAAIDAFLSTDHTRFLRQKEGDKIALELNSMIRDHPEAGKKLTELVDRSTRAGVDFTQGVTAQANAYFNNKNPRFGRQRAEHARLRQEYAKLLSDHPEAKVNEHADKIAGYYRNMQNELITATLKRLITASVEQQAVALPAGKTIDDAIAWVKSGEIDRTGQAQTADDKAYHAAFGKLIDQLQNTTSVRTARGLYAPLMRRGNFAVVAKKDFTTFKSWVPESQQVKGENYLPDGATARNAHELAFTDRAKYEAYAKDTNDQWAGDPKIRESKKKGTFVAFVPVQNHYLSFFEKQFEAEAERQRMLDEGHYKADEISSVQHRKKQTQDQFEYELLPEHVKALLNSMKQNGVTGGMYDLVKKGIVQTQIQSMSGNRAQHRKLKREFTHGNATDMVKAMRDYNMGASSYLATIEQMPLIQKGLDELQTFIDTHPADPNIMRMQEMLDEVKRRVDDPGDFRNHPMLRTFTNLSYLNHLFSPAFLAMQYMQPIYSTIPALSGVHGVGASLREMYSAMSRMGAGSVYGKGITELHKAALDQETTDATAQLLARQELTDLDRGVLGRMVQQGLMDPEGVQEEALRRLDANPLDRAMAPANRILQHVAGSIEAVNRAVTGMAAAKLHFDKHGDIEAAIQHGVYMTEQTQFGYGKANAPPIFQHPIGRVVFQFKKYALGIGNFLARQIYQSINPMKGGERAQAIKSLAFMFGTYMMFSGLSGGAPWEPLKVVWMALGLLMPSKVSGDWAVVENAIQAFAAKGLGKKGAEVLMRGLPRLIGIDMSNRISLSSLALFGSPKDQKTDSLKSWLFDLIGGAPTSMAMNTIDGIAKADFGSPADAVNSLAKIVPLPKMVRDITGGVAAAVHGTVLPSGKKVSGELTPLEAVGKGLGFQPASKAREWETGGSGWEKKQEKVVTDARTSAAKPWFDADRTGDPAAREKAWQDIEKGWNADHPEKPITKKQLDITKKRRATEDKKKQAKEKAE